MLPALRHTTRAWLCGVAMAGCGAEVPAVARPYFDVPMNCPNFCNVTMRHCRGEWLMYSSFDACLSTCATWPDTPGEHFTTGNTLQCRFVYASMVTHVQDTASYCYSAGPSGGQNCHD